VLALVLLVLTAALDGLRLWSGIGRVELVLPGSGGTATNYLLVGSDSREFVSSLSDEIRFGKAAWTVGERADMLVVVHVPATGPAVLLNVPRDTVVRFPGNSGIHRLSLALTKGEQYLIDVFCSSLGIGIDHLVLVGLDGFRKLVDAVGGIELDLPAPIREPYVGLAPIGPGRTHLDGDQALALLRSRHPEELVEGRWQQVRSGIGARLTHGEQVLAALAPRVDDRSRSWLGVRSLVSAVGGSVRVDSNAGYSDMRHLATALEGLSGTRMTPGVTLFEQLPVDAHDGPAPAALLRPEATGLLESFGAGNNPRCPLRPERLTAEHPGIDPDEVLRRPSQDASGSSVAPSTQNRNGR